MRRVLCVICSLLMLVGLSSLFSPVAVAAEKVFSFRFAHFMPQDTVQAKVAKEWCAEIEKRTNGRVKITPYFGGILVPINKTYDAVVHDQVDIGYGIFAHNRGRFPLTEVVDLALGYKKHSSPTLLANAYYKRFHPKETDDVKILYLEANDVGRFHLRKNVTKLEDLKGMKIRSSGLDNKTVEALGATPVAMPVTEAYEALSKNIAEGIVLSTGGLWGYKMGELAPYTVETDSVAYTTTFFTAMNKDKWNALPEDIKAIIDAVDEEFTQKAAAAWIVWHDEGREALVKQGHHFIKLSEAEEERWRERMKPVHANYVKVTEAKGLPGKEALEFCQNWLKENDK